MKENAEFFSPFMFLGIFDSPDGISVQLNTSFSPGYFFSYFSLSRCVLIIKYAERNVKIYILI